MTAALEVLVTVKAYPNPSASLGEAACIAGIDRDGRFKRLYPIPFRDLEGDQQFKKYQWIRVRTRNAKRDSRPETVRPVLDTIAVLSDPLPTHDAWAARREIVKRVQSASMCDIQDAQKRDRTSLGFFRPAEVLDVEAKAEGSPSWLPGELEKLSQQDLFLTKDKKPLEKIPVGFWYRFRCEGCRLKEPHRMKIIDWELAQLWRKNRREHDARTTITMVRERFLDQMCGDSKDPHFFVGNMARHPNSFLVLGVFWPPRRRQLGLLT